MYTHIVLFKLNDPRTLDAAVALFASMRGQVPVLKSIDVVTDDVHHDYSADLAIVCRFDRAEDVDVYMKDPFHQNILKETGPLMASKMKIDFWDRK